MPSSYEPLIEQLVKEMELKRWVEGKKDKLNNDSFVVCNGVCFIHKKYIKEKISKLTSSEIANIENIIKNVFDMKE